MTTYAVRATDYGFGNPANSMAQNRNALQSALASGRNVLLPRGQVILHGPLNFHAHGQQVIGEGPDQTILIIHDSSGHSEGNLFITNGLSNIGIQNFTIRGHATSPPNSGWVFMCDGAALHGNAPMQAAGGDIRNIVVNNMFSGFFFRDINTAIVEDVQLQSIRGWAGVYVLALNPNHRVDQLRLKSVIINFNPASVSFASGIGIMLDGNIHTALILNSAIINSCIGLHIVNSANLPVGLRPSFITAYDLQVDYSRSFNVQCTSGHRLRFTDCYFHRAENADGLWFGEQVHDLTINTSVVSSAQFNGIYFAGREFGLYGTQIDRASTGSHNTYHGILLATPARDVRIVGGGSHSDGGQTAQFGIAAFNAAATGVTLAAAEHHRGITGWKNW
jgi:hypothetical protein